MTDQWIESVRPSAFTETNIDCSMVGIRFGVLGRLRLKPQQKRTTVDARAGFGVGRGLDEGFYDRNGNAVCHNR